MEEIDSWGLAVVLDVDSTVWDGTCVCLWEVIATLCFLSTVRQRESKDRRMTDDDRR
jgi:hypothetical protein